MDTSSTVSLTLGGSFRADGPSGRHGLLFDAVGGAWMLASDLDSGSPRLMAQATGLDHGLGLLMAACGRIGQFRVHLPCGNAFARPGKVPAGEILAAFGYRAVSSVTAFTVLERPDSLSSDEVRRELVVGLPGGVGLGEVEATETDGGVTYWCCDLSVAFEGMMHVTRADAIVEEALSGCPFEPAGRAEVETEGVVAPNAASVLSFRVPRAA